MNINFLNYYNISSIDEEDYRRLIDEYNDIISL